MRLVWAVIPIGIIAFVSMLLVPQMYEDKQALIFSKESCESFDGFWNEQYFECNKISFEECAMMGRTLETSDMPTVIFDSSKVCK